MEGGGKLQNYLDKPCFRGEYLSKNNLNRLSPNMGYSETVCPTQCGNVYAYTSADETDDLFLLIILTISNKATMLIPLPFIHVINIVETFQVCI